MRYWVGWIIVVFLIFSWDIKRSKIVGFLIFPRLFWGLKVILIVFAGYFEALIHRYFYIFPECFKTLKCRFFNIHFPEFFKALSKFFSQIWIWNSSLSYSLRMLCFLEYYVNSNHWAPFGLFDSKISRSLYMAQYEYLKLFLNIL